MHDLLAPVHSGNSTPRIAVTDNVVDRDIAGHSLDDDHTFLDTVPASAGLVVWD